MDDWIRWKERERVLPVLFLMIERKCYLWVFVTAKGLLHSGEVKAFVTNGMMSWHHSFHWTLKCNGLSSLTQFVLLQWSFRSQLACYGMRQRKYIHYCERVVNSLYAYIMSEDLKIMLECAILWNITVSSDVSSSTVKSNTEDRA